VLGAEAKLDALRASRDGDDVLRRRLADRVRSRSLPVDVQAADDVRRTGFSRP
jgi:hypothetical protein